MDRKMVAAALIAAALVLSAGCGDKEWESKGKVDMKKLVALEELWEKREQYVGKVVTIGWGQEYLESRGNTDPIGKDRVMYDDAGYFYNERGYTSEGEWLKDAPAMEKVVAQDPDSLLPGEYYISLLLGSEKQVGDYKKLVPEWAEYKGGHLKGYDLNVFRMSKQKFVTGVLVDTGKYGSGTVKGYKRSFYIVPIGYRISKGKITS